MKYRFKWNDKQILLVLNRIKDDRVSLIHDDIFHRVLSVNEEYELKWTPDSNPEVITALVQSVCVDEYISKLRGFVRASEHKGKVDSSSTIRLSSESISTINILSEFDECQGKTKAEIVACALDRYWNCLEQDKAKLF